ncbi:uncharacterized protein [Ptychodera flava]
MFSGSWKESDASIIAIDIPDNNIDEEALEVALGSLYKDDVLISPSRVVTILAAAALLQLDGLINQCSDIMTETMSTKTVCSYHGAATSYGLTEVATKCVEWLQRNLMLVQSISLLRDLRDVRCRVTMDEIDPGYIRELVQIKNLSHQQISAILQREFPNRSGFSKRSVRRFCEKNDIRKIGDEELDTIVTAGINEVGPTYGRKMMLGYLRSKGYGIGRRRIMQSLKRSDPYNHNRRRQDTVRTINPVAYFAPYFGHKLHVDQNEKLVFYGATIVLFSDGCSRKIVGYASMPVKNNLIIYEEFRRVVLSYGIWDMVRVDHGREFFLTLFIQQHPQIQQHRRYQGCPPYVQTPSTENLPAERKWPEINQRVSYPIKAALNDMHQRLVFDMTNPIHRFCVSYLTLTLADVGIVRFIRGWNAHPIEDVESRIPNDVARLTKNTGAIPEGQLPDTETAMEWYQAEGGQCEDLDSLDMTHWRGLFSYV